jgi:hypothetical protein
VGEPENFFDEQAIIALTIGYCWALDSRQFADLREVFLTDGVARYAGRDAEGVDAIMARCSAALSPLDESQHMVANHQVHVDGDRATSRCYFQAQHTRRGLEGGENFIIAGRYEDECIRTPEGWRIKHRVLTTMWSEGNPKVVRPDG